MHKCRDTCGGGPAPEARATKWFPMPVPDDKNGVLGEFRAADFSSKQGGLQQPEQGVDETDAGVNGNHRDAQKRDGESIAGQQRQTGGDAHPVPKSRDPKSIGVAGRRRRGGFAIWPDIRPGLVGLSGIGGHLRGRREGAGTLCHSIHLIQLLHIIHPVYAMRVSYQIRAFHDKRYSPEPPLGNVTSAGAPVWRNGNRPGH